VRVYDVRDTNDRLVSFEFDNTVWLQTLGTRRLIASLQGARLLPPSQGDRLEGEFCRFEFEGCRWVVFEPFGDNSRVVVSSLDDPPKAAMEAVRARFASHRPATWFQLATVIAVISLLGGLAAGLVAPSLGGAIGLKLLVAGAVALVLLFLVGIAGLAGRSTVSLLARLRGGE